MSRQQIDALVGAVIRAEDTGGRDAVALAPEPVPPRGPRRPRSGPSGRRLLGLVVAVTLAAVGARLLMWQLAMGVADPNGLLGGVPAHPTVHAGSDFTFLQTQPLDPEQPVGYNPCLTIPVEINYLDAPPDILELTKATIRQINQVSGLHLRYVGASQRYRTNQGVTGRILISFNDIPHDGYLQDAAGFGGSYSYGSTPAGSTKYYVGGEITMNIDEFNRYPHRYQALVLAHELGHTLGLGHANGNHQVMSSGDYSVRDWGEGDLTGLAELGKLPCR